MAASQDNLADFQSSCNDAEAYPTNLLRTETWEHTLVDYQKELGNSNPVSDEDDSLMLFDESQSSIYALDYKHVSQSFELSQKLDSLESIRKLVNGKHKDMRCRYFFIHARSSRSPLGCSKEQLLHIMSHHQIMAPFLNHVFTFCEREKPYTSASFTSEDYLSLDDKISSISALGRSGLQVQHCFNLVGIEYDQKLGSWPHVYRQTAAYYSFDPLGGQSVWLVLKANELIKQRFQKSSEPCKRHRALCDLGTPESSLSAGLKAHLLIYEWCIENWTQYLDFLEEKTLEASAFVKHVPVRNLLTGKSIEKRLSKRSTFPSAIHSRQDSGFQKQRTARSASWNKMIELSRRLQVLSHNKSHGPESPIPLENQEQPSKLEDLDLDEIYSFNQLQSLHRIASNLESASLVIGQNKKVLEEMLGRFIDLHKSDDLKRYMAVEKVAFDAFFRRTRGCVRELESQQARLVGISVGLDKNLVLFNGILQYKNMRIGEYFAHHAKVSTEKMEELTVKTKHETVSIHVITLLTLVFLPGTFVAVRYGLPYLYSLVAWALTTCQTFFSSGIIDFDETRPLHNLGEWTMRWGALKLFGIVGGALMILVMSAWALAYYMTRHHSREESLDEAVDEEKGE